MFLPCGDVLLAIIIIYIQLSAGLFMFLPCGDVLLTIIILYIQLYRFVHVSAL